MTFPYNKKHLTPFFFLIGKYELVLETPRSGEKYTKYTNNAQKTRQKERPKTFLLARQTATL